MRKAIFPATLYLFLLALGLHSHGTAQESRDLLRYNCTIVAILHDLNLALQYGDSFVVLDSGRVVAETERAEGISRELLERVFRVRAHRIEDDAEGQSVW